MNMKKIPNTVPAGVVVMAAMIYHALSREESIVVLADGIMVGFWFAIGLILVLIGLTSDDH